MNNCNFRGHKNFREKNAQYVYRHDGKFLVVNNVPCDECEFCGEQYFKAEDLKKIEKDFNNIYIAGKKPEQEIKIPFEEFAGI